MLCLDKHPAAPYLCELPKNHKGSHRAKTVSTLEIKWANSSFRHLDSVTITNTRDSEQGLYTISSSNKFTVSYSYEALKAIKDELQPPPLGPIKVVTSEHLAPGDMVVIGTDGKVRKATPNTLNNPPLGVYIGASGPKTVLEGDSVVFTGDLAIYTAANGSQKSLNGVTMGVDWGVEGTKTGRFDSLAHVSNVPKGIVSQPFINVTVNEV